MFGSPFANNLGLLAGANAPNTQGSNTPERYPGGHGHNSTMATAASQAASLAGLHSASEFCRVLCGQTVYYFGLFMFKIHF